MQRGRWKRGLLCLGVLFFLWVYRDAAWKLLSIAVISLIFVLALLPICCCARRRGLSASVCALVSVLLLLVLFAVAVSVVVPFIASHVLALISALTPMLAEIMDRVVHRFSVGGAESQLWAKGYDLIAAPLSGLGAVLARGGVSAAEYAGNIVIALVIAYYILREWDMFFRMLLLCLPLQKRGAVLAGISACRVALLGYMSSIVKTSAFVAGATFAGLSVIRVENALLLSLIMGVMEVLPYAGPVIAAIPIFLSALQGGIVRAALAMGVVAVVQQIESSFIGPYFTASSTSVHPLAAFAGVCVMGSFFGIWGILFAVPLLVIGQAVVCSCGKRRISYGQ